MTGATGGKLKMASGRGCRSDYWGKPYPIRALNWQVAINLCTFASAAHHTGHYWPPSRAKHGSNTCLLSQNPRVRKVVLFAKFRGPCAASGSGYRGQFIQGFSFDLAIYLQAAIGFHLVGGG